MKPSPRPWKNPFSAIITHYSSSSSTQELPATATEKRDNPPKSFNTLHGTQCMHILQIKVQFDKNFMFSLWLFQRVPTKIRACTDLSVIHIFLQCFFKLQFFFPFFGPMWARQVVAAHDHRRGMLLNHQGYGRFRFHNFTQELLDDILFEAFI